MGRVGPDPEGVDAGVLEEEQVVVGRRPGHRPLEGQGLGVGDEAQLAHPQHAGPAYSSDAQSRLPMSSAMRRRNEET